MVGHLRRLKVLVLNLPPEAMVWRTKAFAPNEEFLVQVLENMDLWVRIMLAVQSGKQVKLPPPLQILRPGDERPVKKKASLEEIAAFFSKI